MISRNDIVKQFEFVVKQEIVNNDRAIDQNNRKILELEKKFSNLEVYLTGKITGFENLLASYEGKFIAIQQSIDHLYRLCSDNSAHLSYLDGEFKSSFKQIVDAIESLKQWIAYVEKSVIDNLERQELDYKQNISGYNDVKNSLENVRNLLSDKIDKNHEEILNAPSEALIVKEDLLKNIDVCNGNFLSVNQILKKINQDLMYFDHKWQYAFKEIDKLKGDS